MFQMLIRLLSPALCLILALLLRWYIPQHASEQLPLLSQLPYIFCLLAAAMALFANHSRELAASINMLLVFWLIQNFLQASLATEPAGQIFSLLSLGLPLLLTLLLIAPDKGLRHPTGIAAVLIGPAVALIIAGIFAWQPLWFADQSAKLIASPLFGLKLSTTAGTLFISGFILALILLFMRNSNAESSLLGCALFSFVTLAWFQLPHISSTLFTGVGLLLIVNQIHSLLNLVYNDELTQIANRRALLQAAKSLGQTYSLAMVDIDHFKKINDTHGHDLGDQVLKVVAGQLRQVGGGGRAYRYGGEEFCILFKNKTAEEVKDTLEELRKTIAGYDMVIRDGKSRPRKQQAGEQKRGATRRKSNIRITVSMGVGDSCSANGMFDPVMKAADKAMYKAKRLGRNQLRLA